MRQRITFGIGTGEDKHGNPIWSDRARTITDSVRAYLVRRFGGCFIVDGFGAWKDDSGKVISEPGIHCIVDLDSTEHNANVEARQTAIDLCGIADQTAIMVGIGTIRGGCIYADSQIPSLIA